MLGYSIGMGILLCLGASLTGTTRPVHFPLQAHRFFYHAARTEYSRGRHEEICGKHPYVRTCSFIFVDVLLILHEMGV